MIFTFHNVGKETLFVINMLHNVQKKTLLETKTFHNVGKETLLALLEIIGLLILKD